MKKLFLFGLLCALLVAVYVKKAVYEPGPLVEDTVVLINRGAGSGSVAEMLSQAGVIKHPFLFKLAARLQGLDKHLKAGEYQFASHVSMADVLAQMAKGEVLYRKLTLPEGLTTAQMLKIIQSNELLSGEITLEPEDGSLLPETYSFFRGDSRDSVIIQAQEAMQKALSEAWGKRDETVPVKNSQELLVLASIIEKETGVPEERGLVASVFVNRLRKGMRLQTDPTVIYALTEGKKDLGRLLTRKDLEIDSPYNTYKYYGLPPKPICNPGKASLEAAANPEVSSYLYFVADGTGGHRFANSLNEHNQNVSHWKKYQRNNKK